MATCPIADELSNRLDTLEKAVDKLANQLADHTASLPPLFARRMASDQRLLPAFAARDFALQKEFEFPRYPLG